MNAAESMLLAQQVLNIEAEALQAQAEALDEAFVAAWQWLLQQRGRLIVMGIGKSGHIGEKAAATFASTGCPAFFVHPAEAGHGDLGMITAEDTLLLLSYSGESAEILTLLPALKALGVKLMAMTGNPASTLARAADIHLTIVVKREACPLNLAPTSSTTATLALCDALAIVLMQAKAFAPHDFARSHPLGRLGRRLTTRVSDLMREAIPQNRASDSIQEALFELSSKGVGATFIVENGTLQGIFTDGDLRRALQKNISLDTPLAQVMKREPYQIQAEELAAEALQFMQDKKISVLPVLREHQLCGVLQLHDVLRAGVA